MFPFPLDFLTDQELIIGGNADIFTLILLPDVFWVRMTSLSIVVEADISRTNLSEEIFCHNLRLEIKTKNDTKSLHVSICLKSAIWLKLIVFAQTVIIDTDGVASDRGTGRPNQASANSHLIYQIFTVGRASFHNDIWPKIFKGNSIIAGILIPMPL